MFPKTSQWIDCIGVAVWNWKASDFSYPLWGRYLWSFNR